MLLHRRGNLYGGVERTGIWLVCKCFRGFQEVFLLDVFGKWVFYPLEYQWNFEEKG